MKQIFGILKKSMFPILFVIVLLVLQAQCDLSLPQYTSDIINVGIQQNGIDSLVPTVVSKSTMEHLSIFLKDDEKLYLLENYRMLDESTLSENSYQKYVKKYPLLKTEAIYLLNDSIDTQDKQQLAQILQKPLILLAALSNESVDFSTMFPNDLGMDFWTVLMNMSEEQKEVFANTIFQKLENIDISMQEQIAIAYIKAEYQTVGIELKEIQTGYIVKTGLKMLGISLFLMAIAITISFLSSKVASSFSRDLRCRVVRKVMTFSTKEFEDFQTASLITRSTNDIQQIQMLITMLLRVTIYAPIIGIGALIKVQGNSMSWIIALAVFLITILVVLLFTIAMPKFQKVQKLIDKVNLVAREILTGLPVIRAFSTEKYEEKRFDQANINLTKTNLFVNRIMSIMMPTMTLIMNGICVLIVWVGAEKIDIGTMQVGNLFAFIQYTMQIIMAFLMISMISIMLPRAIISVKRIAAVLNTENSIKELEQPVAFDTASRGIVEFKDVYFRYPDAEEDVLSNISFKAKPGTTTAFIGSTGSGKSTLINLIPRFFDVTGGKILIDGVDIRKVSVHDLHAKIGYVPQKGMLFSGTIESNIKFGNSSASDEQVVQAATIAQATEFIEDKEDQYQSPISQGGNNVSGGQKQRLAIARAIAVNPEIYIFDDSFSALDYKTDIKLRRALQEVTKESTIFIVAQRISTVLTADQIIVLDQGKIMGIGTHQELMETCDVYKQIALSQLSKEELTDE